MRFLKRTITVNADTKVSSIWAVPEEYRGGRAVILAHGAGNDMESPFVGFFHKRFAERGLLSVKFNFPYKERGGRAPDRAPLLEATWRAVAEAVRRDPELAPKALFFAGKSMGGRIASHLAAAGEACAGLIFLGYPLHPPNKPQKPRAEHLASIACPMLFVQGSRDTLCRLDLLEQTLRGVAAPVRLHVIEGGDHSFKVVKRLGRSEEEVLEEAAQVATGWMEEVSA